MTLTKRCRGQTALGYLPSSYSERFNRALGFWCLVAVLTGSTPTSFGASEIVFYESMGVTPATRSVAAHQTDVAFDNFNYIFGNGGAVVTADVRDTSASLGYTNVAGLPASGLANIFFGVTTNERGFAIAGINSLAHSNLTLSFAYRKEATGSNGIFAVEWSTNSGVSWNSITVTGMPAGGAGTGWYLLPQQPIPEDARSTNLWLRWVQASSNSAAFRIDDVLLYGDPGISPVLPIVLHPTASNLTTSSATLGGTIVFAGNDAVGERGVFYSTNSAFVPPGQGTKVSEFGLFSEGPFSLSVTGLSPNTTYFFRSFASNNQGSGFSPKGSFAILGPPPSNALVYFTFTGDSVAPEFVASGIVASNFAVSAGSISFGTANGATWTGSGVPYAQATGGWGSTDQATAKHFRVVLSAATGKVFSITNISFLCRRTGAGPTNVGISVNSSSVLAMVVAADTTTSINQQVSGFADLTGAVVRIEGWLGAGGDLRVDDVLVRGLVYEILALPPTVTTPTSSNVTHNTASLGGTIVTNGGATVTERGVYWSTNSGFAPPGEGTKASQIGSFGIGPFSVTATGLPSSATVYFRAFAANVAGPGFSAEASIVTSNPPPSAPTVSTTSVANVTESSASLGGVITTNGGLPVTRRGISWSTTQGFDPAGGTIVDETGSFGTGAFAVAVGGLPAGTRVYFRALAENAAGTGYSPEAFFMTAPNNTLVFYAFYGPTATPTTVGANISATSFGLSTGTLDFGTGNATNWTGSGVPYAEESGGWTNDSQSSAKHFRFTINANTGFVFSITNISLLKRATPAGPSAMGVSIAGTSIHSQNQTQDLVEALSLPVTGFVGLSNAEIRIEGWTNGSRSTAGTGAFRVDDVSVQGTVTPTGGGGGDTDGDGIPDEWETLHFGGPTNAAPGVDSDGDKFNNLEEYIAGTIPTNGLSFFEVENLFKTGAVGRVIQVLSVTGRLYSVDYTTNLLIGGGWTPLVTDTNGGGAMINVLDTNDSPTRSYRSRVRLP